jgi:hypothetical protein
MVLDFSAPPFKLSKFLEGFRKEVKLERKLNCSRAHQVLKMFQKRNL